MRNLTDFAILQEYERIKKLGDKLIKMGCRINWEAFRPKLEAMSKNNTDRGGRPNLDVIVMLKSLFIQQLHSLLPSFGSIRIRSTAWEASRPAIALPQVSEAVNPAFMNDYDGAETLDGCGLYALSFHSFLSA